MLARLRIIVSRGADAALASRRAHACLSAPWEPTNLYALHHSVSLR
jgi:hypothetical protein